MKRILLAATLALAGTAFAQTPPSVADLAWMSGSWVQETAEQRVAETWLGPGNGLMVGTNLTTMSSGRKSFEFLRIADSPAGPSYFASPGGRAPVEFRFKEAGDRRIVFENAAHDFPQRILYWREGESLKARIEGSLKGRERSEEWTFSRR